MMQKLLLIALAGGLGTLARYGLAEFVGRFASPGFPWSTVAVNALGCFLFGLIWALAGQRWQISGEMQVAILVGFMGAFTTFSTFVADTSRLLTEAAYLRAFGNILLHNAFGIAVFFLGLTTGRAF